MHLHIWPWRSFKCARVRVQHMRNTRLEEDKLRLITTRQDVLPVPRREQPTGSDAARFAEVKAACHDAYSQPETGSRKVS